MHTDELKSRRFENDLIYSASRSSGPGGQNVNKVNTRVELRLSVINTLLLSVEEKEVICKKLKNKINKDGELVLFSQEGRSQAENRMIVTERFYKLIAKALTFSKPRKPTRPSLSSKIKRLENKKIRSSVKKMRRPGDTSEEI
jgi:ribosome-associated protein